MEAFIQWWQNLPGNIDPVIFQIGSFRLQYYGLMYLIAFLLTYFLTKYRIKTESNRFPYSEEFIKNIMTYAFVGVLIGGRLGYVLFYNLEYFIDHPLEIILPFDFENGMRFTGISGMSYHGGLIGVIIACAIFARKNKVDYWNLADLFGPAVPLGYTFGRLGNFINGELYGRITDSWIGMQFPSAPDSRLRHPSQLYEAFFEGIFLFLVLWAIRKFPLPKGAMMPAYLFGYGFVRFFIEYFRQPDSHLQFVFLNFTMGQILCLGMMISALILYWYLKKNQPKPERSEPNS